jgi:hypothetical protein
VYSVDTPLGEDSNDEVCSAPHGYGRSDRGHNSPLAQSRRQCRGARVRQDDVIVMEFGAEAIRSQTANGLTWTIDGNASGAHEIQPEKILFATGRVVGRVLAVEHQGSDITVTLGPIELTDVIKDAQITYHGALDLEKMTTYVAPEYPGTLTDFDAADQASALRRPGESSIRVAIFRRTANSFRNVSRQRGHEIRGRRRGAGVERVFGACLRRTWRLR